MKMSMVSLGCDKNTVDSEMMLGLMNEKGFEYTDIDEEADVMIINTCGFIQSAKEESINAILEASKLKEVGNLKALIVTGCLAQRYKDEIIKEIPEVDALLGTSSFDKIVETVEEVLGGEIKNEFLDLDRLPSISKKRKNSTGGYYAYLKIAEGCNKNCTYCIIPSLRGNYRSYPLDDLIAQAKDLATQGIKELILVAQETTLYGVDIYGKKTLPKLLKELAKIEGIEWIRILYCYPEEITDELIDVIASEDKVCKYLDIPIQHASDNILRRMARRTTYDDLVNIIGRLRNNIPDITLRTTIIAGFPGETVEDVDTVIEFIKQMKFERLGVFTYSEEEGTVAAGFDNQIDEKEKEARRDRIMRVQQEISEKNLERKVGKTFRVLIEGKLPDENVYIGRTYMDVPGVDGYVFVNTEREYMSGDFCDVLITGSSEYDLIGDAL
ncbi:30S ribosomal protein S12 methylthiotransferase RimO [Lachnoanaerobaculum saburreum]|uniref:Ribosomal protein uS12 methylthiotransferase RimO n=1 Tax=Lachnoanaerobaculum saburreum DSM 3986 TaxID=887325 RepID=E6LNH7_9FIRM|nr:30S ribosomal protein S12 methylthiotransferase RimO [Lachnoanaerobaculum saburreum]EFU76593.1 ribosomal protein S12 methylthiotransferase RimO [Lachnoanaerobaculum saburreum DSM 3986]